MNIVQSSLINGMHTSANIWKVIIDILKHCKFLKWKIQKITKKTPKGYDIFINGVQVEGSILFRNYSFGIDLKSLIVAGELQDMRIGFMV